MPRPHGRESDLAIVVTWAADSDARLLGNWIVPISPWFGGPEDL